MRYAIQETNTETARLVIEWKPHHGKAARPCLIRYCLDHEGCLAWEKGVVLGFDLIQPCALILSVQKGDLISIGEKIIGESQASRTHYQIGDKFELHQFEIPDPSKTNLGILSRLQPSVARLNQLPLCDDSLRHFLANKSHPEWLIPILERQKKKWRASRPAKFYQLMPSEVADDEIPVCVSTAPGAALRFLRDRISANELRQCIGRDLEAAAQYAFEAMSEVQVDRACLEFPGLLLRHHASQLSEERLLRCVCLDPFGGFHIRNQVEPHLHAKVLAGTLGLPFELFSACDLSDLPNEILQSFLSFTKSWVDAFAGNHQHLLTTLMRHRGDRSRGDYLLHLMEHVPPEYLPHVASFAARFI